MHRTPTDQAIANDYRLWAEYIDPDATMTRAEFDALSVDGRLAIIAGLAGNAGQACPDCGSTHIESNGHTEWRCVECDHRWGHEYGERYGY